MLNKKLGILIVLLIVLATLAIAVKNYYFHKGLNTGNQVAAIVNNRKNLPACQLPPSFPADLPLEQNAKVLQDFTDSKDGQAQSAYSYISAKTVADNSVIFADYFKKNSYIATSSVDSTGAVTLGAQKNEQKFFVHFSQSPNTGSSVVRVSIWENLPGAK